MFAFVRATSADGSGSITERVTTADVLSYLESGGYKVPPESDIATASITCKIALTPPTLIGYSPTAVISGIVISDSGGTL